jgi:uncharacterized protein YkwD
MSSVQYTHCKVRSFALLSTLALLIVAQFTVPYIAYGQQDATLFRDELQILYLINVERQKAGLAPLAWNAEMTESARWFAQDAVETMPSGYCGHTDSLGRSSNQRIRDAGYSGYGSTAENAMCGYIPPDTTVQGWMHSPGHRTNILNPELREAGVGYYLNAAGTGYSVLDLGNDRDYAPLVINNEALTTADRSVRLYLYDQDTGDSWGGVGPTLEMMISNVPDFAGAKWEPYVTEKDWTLDAGEGWRTVYVKARDRLGQTTIVHDAIYLGSQVADNDLALEYATHVDDGFTLSSLPGGYTHIQFSLNWMTDDSDEHFELLDGQGEHVNDAAAVGGAAYRLVGGSGSALAWSWGTSPFGKAPAVAYFRLKASDNSSSQEVAALTINDGKNEVAKLSLAGSDFSVAGQYQEFAVPFTPSAAGNGLIVLFVRRSGASDVLWDSTSFYMPPEPISDPHRFVAPNHYYRSSGAQARLVTPGASSDAMASFSDPLVAYPHLGRLADDATLSPAVRVNPASLVLSTPSETNAPPDAQVALTCSGCGDVTWQVSSDVGWIDVTILEAQVRVHADPAGLGAGVHSGTITLTAAGRTEIPAVTLPISLIIGNPETLFPRPLYMPAIVRH